MNLTDIRDLYREKESYIGKKITVGGWVRSIRDSKTFGFLVVNDGTFFEPLQVVYSERRFRHCRDGNTGCDAGCKAAF